MRSDATTKSDTPIACYRGRIWFGLYLAVMAVCLLALVLVTPLIDHPWFALVSLGLPSLVSAYGCATLAFAETVAKVELRSDGFTLRLPSYRGYFPSWPVQRLEARWSHVKSLSRRTVRARLLTLPYDYVLHRIATDHGEILMFEALPGFSRNTKGASANLPVSSIIHCFATRTGLTEKDCGTDWGGGIWRNLIAPSHRASFPESTPHNSTPAATPAKITHRLSD